MSNRDFLLGQLLDVSHHPIILGVKGMRFAEEMAAEIIDTLQNQNKLGFFGAEPFEKATELLAAEFKSGLTIKREELPVVLINSHCSMGDAYQIPNGTDASDPILTKIEELMGPGDLLIILTQEATEVIARIIMRAQEKQIKTLMLCGYPLPKGINPDQLFCIPLINRSRLEEIYIIFWHLVGVVVESVLFSGGNSF